MGTSEGKVEILEQADIENLQILVENDTIIIKIAVALR